MNLSSSAPEPPDAAGDGLRPRLEGGEEDLDLADLDPDLLRVRDLSRLDDAREDRDRDRDRDADRELDRDRDLEWLGLWSSP